MGAAPAACCLYIENDAGIYGFQFPLHSRDEKNTTCWTHNEAERAD